MASFIPVPFMLVFHQSKCISVIKRILFCLPHVYILVCFRVFVCFLLMQCMHKSRVFHAGVKTLHNTLFVSNRRIEEHPPFYYSAVIKTP